MHRFATHYKWVIMLIILAIGITLTWVLSCVLRKRYLRKKEKEYEMRPPVAWGPHQLQGNTPGFTAGLGSKNGKGKGKVVHASVRAASPEFNEKKAKQKWVVTERT
jgi:hypothetical protein